MDSTNIKIKQIIDECNLTPSRFADEIGVQRAIISHILAGRNKPSLDIIVKINKWNSSYTLDYFTDDVLQEAKNDHQTPYSETIGLRNNINTKPLDLNRKNQAHADPIFSNDRKEISPPPVINDGNKQVERILIFYTDKTFSEYRPA